MDGGGERDRKREKEIDERQVGCLCACVRALHTVTIRPLLTNGI